MKARRGVILMNSGAPASTQEVDQRRYYKEVSRDRHVTNRLSVVDAVVHPMKLTQASKTCRTVWNDNGSPLIHSCKQIRNTLRARLNIPVELGMLYGEPSVARAVGKLLDAEIEELCVLPLFPQYSIETFEACIAKVKQELRQRRSGVLMRVISPFYSHPAYIRPMAAKLEDAEEHVLFCYRGLSLQHLKKPDTRHHCLSSITCCSEPSGAHETCYRFQCLKTTHLIVEKARIPANRYSVSFHSRHSQIKCIEPYTMDTLRLLPSHGQKHVTVICPSHFTDSRETLGEIEIEGQQVFTESGGESFRMISGLNASESGIACLERILDSESFWQPRQWMGP